VVRQADYPAVSETRRLLRDHLRRWGVPALADTAELLATEILTNALQHTAGGAVLTATLSPGPEHRLCVEVHDSAAQRFGSSVRAGSGRGAADGDPGEHATSGRGLILVQALSDAWGTRTHDTGKVVWFELDVKTA
jgi:anti-sigma regulatory factor (Ser/Thr protein kinase)